MNQSLRKIAIVAVVALGLLGLHYTTNWDGGSKQASMISFPSIDTQVDDSSDQPLRNLRDLNDAIVDIAEKTNPTVVTIFTEQTIEVRQRNPFFPFFGEQPEHQREIPRQGLGSGVIVDDKGHILTNHHVVADADTINIRLYNDQEIGAKVVGSDPMTDIAVLKVDAENLPSVNMGNSDSLRVGEFVLAIGSPLSPDLAHTVTMGIVSARGRTVQGLSTYQDFIQTDAAINPGNSGGALINLDGELVGINTAIASRSGGYQGIGFAIPINMAKMVMESILEHGRVVRGYIGIRMGEIDETMAKALELDRPRGVLVNNVEDGTPADKAGLKEGDVILELNGEKVKNMRLFASRVAAIPPGQTIKLSILRDGDTITKNVTLTERPQDLAQGGSGSGGSGSLANQLGFDTETLDRDIAEQYDIRVDARGVVVTSINPRSSAYQQGLREGDLIVSIKNQRITNKAEFNKAMQALIEQGNEVALLRVIREGQGIFIAFQLG